MSTVEFNAMLGTYQKNLEYFALSLTNSYEDSRDLLHDTLLRALQYKDRFKENVNFKSWLFTIMKNTFINNYRRNDKKRSVHDQIRYAGKVVKGDRAQETPDHAISYKELMGSVDSLKEDLRIPFTMHHDGYKYGEIADKLGSPIGTIKSKIHMARKELQGKLKEYRHA